MVLTPAGHGPGHGQGHGCQWPVHDGPAVTGPGLMPAWVDRQGGVMSWQTAGVSFDPTFRADYYRQALMPVCLPTLLKYPMSSVHLGEYFFGDQDKSRADSRVIPL